MECVVCNKKVNEMSLFCDKCGAQLLEAKVQLTIANIDPMIQPYEFNNPYSEDLEEEIRKAYYVSLLKDLTPGSYAVNVDKYFDYLYLRLLFEEEKHRLLDNEYPKEVAMDILLSFTKSTINNTVKELFSHRFKEDYTEKRIPKQVIERVPIIYISKERKIQNIVIARTLGGLLRRGILSFILSVLLLSVLSAILVGYQLYTTLTLQGITLTVFTDYIQTNMIYAYVPVGIAFVWAIFKAFTHNRSDVVKHMFTKNKALKKQIKKEIKPLVRRVKKRKQTT